MIRYLFTFAIGYMFIPAIGLGQVLDSNAVARCKASIRAQPSSEINLVRVKNLLYTEDYETVMPIYNSLPDALKRSEKGLKIASRIEAARNMSVGMLLPDLELPDMSGRPVKLSDLRGKPFLLDIWASWCVPCRKLTPQLRKLYNKHAAKGFTIVSISLDRPGARQAWVNAAKSDQMTWMQLSDLKGWQSAAVKAYGVYAIPQYFLVSADGHITAKNLPIPVLDKKISELVAIHTATP
ncbi:TlpA family protein disulfide reductase [Mucilaginibacter daejeonensis]|uniref:peroxiredoxin family protein n=1 Tax=Mucilaginibacter daejeonensis TaxID=398049 RepID=UPI001D179676|nr:TlpA disulfide reductase family protein [Mucilaginibacter daejeonensis]UEG52814.1 TlpA family protein disulfide reductase [Mucilaginibacter daejeonensis]